MSASATVASGTWQVLLRYLVAAAAAFVLLDWFFAAASLQKSSAERRTVSATYTEYRGGQLQLADAQGHVASISCRSAQPLCDVLSRSGTKTLDAWLSKPSLWQGTWLVSVESAGVQLLVQRDQAASYTGARRFQFLVAAVLAVLFCLLWLGRSDAAGHGAGRRGQT